MGDGVVCTAIRVDFRFQVELLPPIDGGELRSSRRMHTIAHHQRYKSVDIGSGRLGLHIEQLVGVGIPDAGPDTHGGVGQHIPVVPHDHLEGERLRCLCRQHRNHKHQTE